MHMILFTSPFMFLVDLHQHPKRALMLVFSKHLISVSITLTDHISITFILQSLLLWPDFSRYANWGSLMQSILHFLYNFSYAFSLAFIRKIKELRKKAIKYLSASKTQAKNSSHSSICSRLYCKVKSRSSQICHLPKSAMPVVNCQVNRWRIRAMWVPHS